MPTGRGTLAWIANATRAAYFNLQNPDLDRGGCGKAARIMPFSTQRDEASEQLEPLDSVGASEDPGCCRV